jgi:hypothetical protein
MRAYVITTGSVFGLLVVMHVWRMLEEGPQMAKDPFFILMTALSAVLCLWACRVLTLIPREHH